MSGSNVGVKCLGTTNGGCPLKTPNASSSEHMFQPFIAGQPRTNTQLHVLLHCTKVFKECQYWGCQGFSA